ncbi:PrsW family intramembrane metalloprotease [Paenarthrobacter sp. Z7-10]|uniref:PrsW family intramembrane metalloprotease n=1 Tax=Paenarthrobacter sp. Z7-10 TaxID=2787635 RepID=UPI0022A9283A|nr:PrsW family intramembrane metalloprotease [Paenarthrobacter sp. Z7-10]MCZ2402724.1 PrsW family intramembrane metalloprotease [Paenarthrobacter sp. Z7-10]
MSESGARRDASESTGQVPARPNYTQASEAPPVSPRTFEPAVLAPLTPVSWNRPPARSGSVRFRVINIVLSCVLVLITAGTLAFFAGTLGPGVFLICGALALVPLGICLLTLFRIDRWEPEPKTAVLFAFCWGAGMSVAAALVLGGWVKPVLMANTFIGDPDTVSSILQAPLVEELCKGTGVLLIFLLRRRTFDGPLDGVIYGGMVGAGFAFTENILYFGSAMAQTHEVGRELFATFLVRGLMSPFAHVMFTATMGAILGYAARRGSTALALLSWLAGLIPAMGLHALWNSSSLISSNFFAAYALLQVPVFLLFATGVLLLGISETRLTRRRLADYVGPGWFVAEEALMLGTAGGRRRALAWAGSFGAKKAMRDFIALATRLAFTRQRILFRPQSLQLQQDELALLHQLAAARAGLQRSAALRRNSATPRS